MPEEHYYKVVYDTEQKRLKIIDQYASSSSIQVNVLNVIEYYDAIFYNVIVGATNEEDALQEALQIFSQYAQDKEIIHETPPIQPRVRQLVIFTQGRI